MLPSLLLSYAGQTAAMLGRGGGSGNPFFLLAPTWAIYPLVGLAAAATVNASQAVITGSFSMTRQAMQLLWLPAVNIRQTSDQVYGQIYVPVVNWLMMLATVAITVGFASSDRLAGAYGTAVSTTMLLTSGLMLVAMRRIWHWPLPVAIGVGAIFVGVDAAFFGANLLKIADGGWVPLGLGSMIFLLMLNWRSGVEALQACLARSGAAEADGVRLLADLEAGGIPRVPGTAVFLTRSTAKFPRIVLQHVANMGALHRHVLTLQVLFTQAPRVASAERWSLDPLGPGLWHATVRFGFIEVPHLGRALASIRGLDPEIDLRQAIYFGTRDLIVRRPGSRRLGRAGLLLFAFLYRNAVKVVDRFQLPAERVVEVARLIAI